jgi:hypothetical protein
MKMTKTQFKNMVKECLLEIIKEGQIHEIATSQHNSSANHASYSASSAYDRERIRSSIRNAVLENPVDHGDMSNGFNYPLQHDSAGYNMGSNQKMLIENMAMNMAKGNSQHAATYAAIFADTAINTIPKQAAAGDTQGAGGLMGASHGNMTEIVSEQGLQKLAGGDMARWATVAFGGKKAK